MAGINLRNTTLSKVGQTQKDKHHTILLAQDSICPREDALWQNLYGSTRMDPQPKLIHHSVVLSYLFIFMKVWLPRGGGCGRVGWTGCLGLEDADKLLHPGWIHNQVLL